MKKLLIVACLFIGVNVYASPVVEAKIEPAGARVILFDEARTCDTKKLPFYVEIQTKTAEIIKGCWGFSEDYKQVYITDEKGNEGYLPVEAFKPVKLL